MNISRQNMVTPNEILADALRYCGDESFKDSSRGYYVSLIQRAMQELAFDTFFDERTEFFDVPENLNLEMPKGSFNIKQVYLLNGDNCGNIEGTQNVYWKRNYYTKGNGYLARDKVTNHGDPFYENRSISGGGNTSEANLRRTSALSSIRQLYYYNIQNGMIMLSSTAKNFKRIAIVFNGVGTDIGEVPSVPMLFREAVISWVIDNALQIKLALLEGAAFNKWQTLYAINNAKLTKPYTGLGRTLSIELKLWTLSKERT